MKERQSEAKIFKILSELQETQVTHTVEMKNFGKVLNKVENSLFGNGTDKEGLITKQAKMSQKIQLMLWIAGTVITTATGIFLTATLL